MSSFIEVRISPDQSHLIDLDQICLVKTRRGERADGELIVEIFFSGIDPPVVLERKMAEDFLPIFRNHVRVRYNIPHRPVAGTS